MSLTEVFLIGIGLSMDAFAVSVCKGLKARKFKISHCIIIALFFGVFQAIMPTLGFLLGSRFADKVNAFAPWIAFFLLCVIGGNMLKEACSKDDTSGDSFDVLDLKELFLMAVATSIDAFAVGISFALMGGINILSAVSLIGITTFVISFFGVIIGNRFGIKYKEKAEITGGIILILIGLKILLEGCGII